MNAIERNELTAEPHLTADSEDCFQHFAELHISQEVTNDRSLAGVDHVDYPHQDNFVP